MVALSTTGDLVAALARAHTIAFSAYVLRPGSVLSALEHASKSGARVVVRLEGRPYADSEGALLRGNNDAIAALKTDGADASLSDISGDCPLHLKAAVVDGTAVFLDDRNWPDDGMDTILRDDNPADVHAVRRAIAGEPQNGPLFATEKDAALAREARTIYRGADVGEAVDVQSESFGYGRVSAALLNAADRRLPVRLIVAQRDLSPRERSALNALERRGVAIRVSSNDEKMAVTGDQAWLGSANATRGVEDQLDWGLRIFDRDITARLHVRFNQNWNAATPYVPGV